MRSSNILITGASSGLGEEFARQYAMRGKNLILVARNKEKLTSLAKELSDRHPVQVEVLCADLSKPGSAQTVFDGCESAGWHFDLVINNAGVGLFGNLVDQDPARLEEMMMLNMVSLTQLTRLFLTRMVHRREGGIINVASTAAFQPIPHFACYAATKAYVLSLSEALSVELAPSNVKVMALCPGPTETRFFERAAEKSAGSSVKLSMQQADEVVRFAIERFEAGSRVAIPGFLNKASALSASFVPRSLVMKVAGKLMETASK